MAAGIPDVTRSAVIQRATGAIDFQEGMHCSACASKVEKEARKIGGVTAAKVSQPKGTAEIAYDPAKTTPETIAKTITRKTGFKASAAQRDDKK